MKHLMTPVVAMLTAMFVAMALVRVGIEFAEEGVFANGAWVPGRRLNGDQTHQGRHIRLPPGNPQIQKMRLCRYR